MDQIRKILHLTGDWMTSVMAEIEESLHGNLRQRAGVKFSVLGIFRNTSGGEKSKSQIFSHRIDNSNAAAGFPFYLKWNPVAHHNVLKNGAGTAAFFSHNKILII